MYCSDFLSLHSTQQDFIPSHTKSLIKITKILHHLVYCYATGFAKGGLPHAHQNYQFL